MESEVAGKPRGHTAINFHQSGQRPAARYVSGAGVHEECLDQGRWKASGETLELREIEIYGPAAGPAGAAKAD